MFEDVGGEADIDRAVRERQAQPVTANCSPGRRAATRELGAVGLDQHAS